MATYKRQLWTSGYLYRQRCPYCATIVEYTDRQLGYRSWYPNGFVYCTRCRKPIRHNEFFALKADGTPVYATQAEADLAVREGYYSAIGAPVPGPGVVSPVAQPYYAAPPQGQYAAQPAPLSPYGEPNAPYAGETTYAPPANERTSAASTGSASPEDQTAPLTRVCSNCGREYVPGRDHFCSSCGKKLD